MESSTEQSTGFLSQSRAATVPPDSTGISVAIVGGGIVGLVLAHGLLHIGVKVAIYERASNFHEVGAGISFTAVARECMRRLSPAVIRAMEHVAVPNKSTILEYWNGYHSNDNFTVVDESQTKDGEGARRTSTGDPDGDSCELLFSRDQHQVAFWGCLRAQFLDQLASTLPADITHFNKHFTSYTDPSSTSGSVMLHFSDGTSATADAVIGCDGLRSRVRAQLLAKAAPGAILPTYTHKKCYRTLAPISAARAAIGPHKIASQCAHVGPGAHMFSYPVNNSLFNIAFFVTDPLPWPEQSRLTLPGRRSDILDALKDWSPAMRGLANLFPDDPLAWALFDMYENPAPYYAAKHGRICIAGDAAHASTPHHGAGAGFGVEDALAITTAIGEVVQRLKFTEEEYAGTGKDVADEVKARYLSAAFEAYNDSRYERTQWLVRSSNESGQIYDWEYHESKDDPMKMKEEFDRRFKVISDFDVQGMVQDVKKNFGSALAKM